MSIKLNVSYISKFTSRDQHSFMGKGKELLSVDWERPDIKLLKVSAALWRIRENHTADWGVYLQQTGAK